MRRHAGLTAALAAILAGVVAPAASADQEPPGCGTNGLVLQLTKDRTVVRNGDISNYTVTAANDVSGACDLSSVRITLTLPARNGTPSGRVVELVGNATYEAGTTLQQFASVPYRVELDPGVADAVAQVTAEGVLHDAPVNHGAEVVKTVGTSVTQPSATLSVTANPGSGPAPLPVTYTYSLTNESRTDAPISGATVSDENCRSITATGGDSNNNGLLDNGEMWSYTCTETLRETGTHTRTATAVGTNSVDDRPVTIAPASTTVTATAAEPAPAPGEQQPQEPAVLGATDTSNLLRVRLPSTTSPEARNDARCISVPARVPVRAREQTVIRVRVEDSGQGVAGALVRLVGPDLVVRRLTGPDGVVRIPVRARRTGTLVIQSNHCLGADRVTVRGARRTSSRRVPRVTG